MKVLSTWLRSYLPDVPVSDAQLAEDLTLRGIAVDGIFGLAPQQGPGAPLKTGSPGPETGAPTPGSIFEMDITTNRVDAMNHYGIAREAATIYGLTLKPLDLTLPAPGPARPGPANPASANLGSAHPGLPQVSSLEPADSPGAAAPYPVRIADDAKHLCGRFTARILRDITIQPSSGIVAHYFRLLEQKQISNAVDATNYVTQAIGQPTHAFDLDKLAGGGRNGIWIRRARKGERLKTLDGIERTLDSDDLVIADEEKALSIAGVMGGWDSMITPATRNILVEAAWFEPTTIRRSSKRHLLHTDASHRFERGADFNAPPAASALVSQILLESGGYLDGELIDILQTEIQRRTANRPSITLALSEVHRILGPVDAPQGITAQEVETILTGLGCTLQPAFPANATDLVTSTRVSHPVQDAGDPGHSSTLDLQADHPHRQLTHHPVSSANATNTGANAQASDPGQAAAHPGQNASHPEQSEGSAVALLPAHPQSPEPSPAPAVHPARSASAPQPADLRRAVGLPSWRLDLEREIDLIEEVARVYGYNRFQNTLPAFTGTVQLLPHAAAERTVRATLLAAGISEAVSSTFCSAQDAVTFAAQPHTSAAIENPLSEEAGMLRPSLLPGMLAMLAQNLHRDVDDLALFEMGTVFTSTGQSARGSEREDRQDRRNDRVDERPSLAIGLAGQFGDQPVDFYTLKGIVEQVATRFSTRSVYYDRFPSDSGLMPAYLHPGRSARLVIDGSTIGYFGQLHPAEAHRRKLKTTLYLGELRLDRLYALGLRHPMPRELSRFQPVRRDFSFLLPDVTEYAQVEHAIRELHLENLTSFSPAELLLPAQSSQVPPGHFSLLLRTTFQSSDRTLRDEDLQTYTQTLITALESLGGRLRT